MKKWYAGHSYMGINFTYDSPCWKAYVFNSKQERDQWVKENEYDQCTGNYVAETIDKKTAYKIAGIKGKYMVPQIEDNNRLSSRYI
ncbi:hypothetical protein M7775_07770 [Sporomusa sphaeroides DSM 2875]|uniref:hypothetical protein n=1 Tax=Sporomusa sphaeroides TaxID=47679 RepID=UPI0020305633|nr:hypothetical protein [Sporomusa sphaeroides]MCM0758470.1 hypothetical protein [Sporomusa sphaeroides DSM 2875]